ncbi:MAG: TonB family protein [Bacteroidota bacterium]
MSISLGTWAADTLRVQSETTPSGVKPKVTNLSEVMDETVYPISLRQQGVEGVVIVELWIDEKGELTKYHVAKSTNDLLQEIVEGRITLLEFEPAKDALGQNINSKTKLPFQFMLDID